MPKATSPSTAAVPMGEAHDVQAAAEALGADLHAGDKSGYDRAVFLLEGFAEEGSGSIGVGLANRAIAHLHTAIFDDLKTMGEMEPAAPRLLSLLCVYLRARGVPWSPRNGKPAA